MNNQPTEAQNLVSCNIEGYERYPVYDAYINQSGIYKLPNGFIDRWRKARSEHLACQNIMGKAVSDAAEAQKLRTQELHNSALRKLTAEEKGALGIEV